MFLFYTFCLMSNGDEETAPGVVITPFWPVNYYRKQSFFLQILVIYFKSANIGMINCLNQDYKDSFV